MLYSTFPLLPWQHELELTRCPVWYYMPYLGYILALERCWKFILVSISWFSGPENESLEYLTMKKSNEMQITLPFIMVAMVTTSE